MPDQATDVFNSTPTPQETPEQSTPPTDVFADLLKDIKNESGEQKYGDVTKALEGLKNAQSYIPQLKSELSDKDTTIAELRAELDKRSTVEDVVSRLTAKQDPVNPEPQSTPTATGLDEQAAMTLFQKLSEQKERESALSTNLNRVNTQLSTTFGDKVLEAVANKAKELNTTPEALGELSKTSPDLVLSLFQVTPQGSISPSSGNVNIPPQTPTREPLERPSKSLLAGATSREQSDFMKKIREEVYSKYNVQE